MEKDILMKNLECIRIIRAETLQKYVELGIKNFCLPMALYIRA